MRNFLSSLHDEDGSAITEFAISIPALLIILFWSIFFSDLAVVRLKLLEASRFTLWEMTIMRDPIRVQDEVQRRFRNLRSSDEIDADPKNLIGIKDVVITVTLEDRLPVTMTGNANFGGASTGSEGQGIFNSLIGAVNTGLDWMLDRFDLNTNGKAHASVSIEVSNQIIPSRFEMLGTRIGDDVLDSPFTFRDDSYLVFDTWKAWPSPYSSTGFTNRETSPYQSYPTAERMVAAQLKDVAFFGLNNLGFVQFVDSALTMFGLPSLFSVSAFSDGKTGPVTMLPADRIAESWVPGYGLRPYRIGDKTFDNYARSGAGFSNPSAGVDRARPSLPYKIASAKWGGGGWVRVNGFWVTDPENGGYARSEFSAARAENDYFDSYQCRGHFYEGMVDSEGQQGDPSAYSGCASAVDNFLSVFDSLPSFP